jgi:hypothetical protein|tara:strand:+ start:261 stop:1094 length:834 start_codon:yes stop_codon:yes gene_type:complete
MMNLLINEEIKTKFKNANRIALVGTGGNLAIAQHMASDIYRHTGKFCFAPDAVNLTALGGDGDWKESWLEYARTGADLIIAITCRVESPLTRSLENDNVILLSPIYHETISTIKVESTHYHQFECRAMYAIYMLMQQTGVHLPTLPKVVQNNVDVSEFRDNIYCIDIDGTLTEPHKGTPFQAIPIPSRIERVNKLFDEGATIYLMTARGFVHSSTRYPDDILAQQREADYHVRSRTEKQLKEWGVKYTKLFFGKPRAWVYVDDRAINDFDFFLDKDE